MSTYTGITAWMAETAELIRQIEDAIDGVDLTVRALEEHLCREATHRNDLCEQRDALRLALDAISTSGGSATQPAPAPAPAPVVGTAPPVEREGEGVPSAPVPTSVSVSAKAPYVRTGPVQTKGTMHEWIRAQIRTHHLVTTRSLAVLWMAGHTGTRSVVLKQISDALSYLSRKGYCMRTRKGEYSATSYTTGPVGDAIYERTREAQTRSVLPEMISTPVS